MVTTLLGSMAYKPVVRVPARLDYVDKSGTWSHIGDLLEK